jgi:pimeloyl-ACP methyl ester carboxylesterase
VRTYKLLKVAANGRVTPDPLRRWAMQRAARRGSPDYRAANGTVRQSFVRIVNEDFRAELPRVAAPTLLIWGDHDEETPIADARIIERLIPDVGLVVFEGCGHFAYAEELQRFGHIVRTFLGGPPI